MSAPAQELARRLNGSDEVSSLASVECLQEAIRILVAQRQAMHERRAGRDKLESNRLELASRQRQLSRALIDRYRRHADRAAA